MNSQNDFVNIALSLQTSALYGVDPSFAGSTLGPCAGRLAGAQLPLNGAVVQLKANEGANQLHGGAHCLTHAVWNAEDWGESADRAWVRFACAQPDGLDGWPGNRTYSVTYTLFAAGRLRLDYQARSDRAGWFNLSNHSYWNLSGDFSHPAAGQLLQIDADEILYNNSAHLPVEKKAVAHTAFDFRTPTDPLRLMADFADDPQLKNALGYNNAYLLNHTPGRPAASLTLGGRKLSLCTDAPALVLYSGGYLDAQTRLAGGLAASPACALALEAQDWPDAPHFPGAPYRPTPAGQVWTRYIEFSLEG